MDKMLTIVAAAQFAFVGGGAAGLAAMVLSELIGLARAKGA